MDDLTGSGTSETVLLSPPAGARRPAPIATRATGLNFQATHGPASTTQAAAKPLAAHQHSPVLDAWRGVAVTLLMIGHFLPIGSLDCGTLGVELFFVLSGFLMGRILFVKRTPLALFYQRRISRIFPAAYTFLFVMLAYKWYATSGAEPNLSAAVSCLLFYVNYYVAMDPTLDLGFPAGHFWSLCVEEHTYILLSALALIHRKKGVSAFGLISAAILACFVMSIVVGEWTDWRPYTVYWRSDCRAASILCGAMVACLINVGVGRQERYLRVPSIFWGVLAVAMGIAFRLPSMPEFVQQTAGTICLACGLLFISQHARGSLWTFPPFIWLGTISFSLYLWQQPFYVAVKRGQIGAGPAIAAALIVGMMSYLMIERPLRTWLNNRWA